MRKTEIDGHAIELKNLDKVFFPAAGITKGDCVAHSPAPWRSTWRTSMQIA